MPIGFIIAAGVGIGVVAGAVAVILPAPRLGRGARLAGLAVLAPLAAASAFGIAASREPGVSPAWFALYLGLALACAAWAGRLALARRACP